MVLQVEVMFVEIPQWVRELTQRDVMKPIGSFSAAYLAKAMRLYGGTCLCKKM